MKEVDLARLLVSHLENQGMDVYQEVDAESVSKVIDIAVKTDDGMIHTYECKTTFGLSVISQAWKNQNLSDYAWVCAPGEKSGRHSDARALGYHICREYGIGLILVHQTHVGTPYFHVMVEPKQNIPYHRLTLRPEQKWWAEAGNAKGKRVTKFGLTKRRLIEYVQENPSVSLKDAISTIDHHYSTDSTAVNCMRKLINTGVVSLELRKGKLYPMGPGAEN